VIAMVIDQPVREHDIGVLLLKQAAESIVAIRIHDCVAVALIGEHRAGFQDFTGCAGLQNARGVVMLIVNGGTPYVAAIQIKQRHRVPQTGIAGDRPSAPIFGVAGMPARHDDIEFPIGSCAECARTSEGDSSGKSEPAAAGE